MRKSIIIGLLVLVVALLAYQTIKAYQYEQAQLAAKQEYERAQSAAKQEYERAQSAAKQAQLEKMIEFKALVCTRLDAPGVSNQMIEDCKRDINWWLEHKK